MPRFFFDLKDHENSLDETGTDLKCSDAARLAAVTLTGAYLRDNPDLVWDGQEIRVIVRDESGAILFTVVTLSVDSVSHL